MVAGAWPEEMGMIPPVVNCLIFFEKSPPEISAVADTCEKYLWPSCRFNSVMQDGNWVQDDPAMDRGYHFREVQLKDEQDIDEWSQFGMTETLNPMFPPWRITLLKTPPGNRSAAFWQSHHAIGDGLSLLFAASPMLGVEGGDFLGKIPLPNALLPKERQSKSESSGGDSESCCCRYAKMPFRFLKGVFLPGLLKHDAELRINSPLADRMPFLKYNGNRVYTRFPKVSMSKAKLIKERHQCSVNDVLITALTGALRRYSADVRQDPLLLGDESRNIEFKAMFMIALPRPFDPNDVLSTLTNKALYASCPLPIGESTPLGRLRGTIANFKDLKSKPYVAGMVGISDIVTSVAPKSVMQKIASELFSKHTLLITNVPCATVPVTFPNNASGQRFDEMQMVFPNIITQVSIITYNGSVNCNIVADPDLFPEPEKLAGLWVQEFEALISATEAESSAQE